MAPKVEKPTPAQALAKLKKGNEDYVGGQTGGHKIDDANRRKELANKQEPFAVVVTCSDSRVPPERLFGTGVGDLFVIRNAGNTVDTCALGSIQYAVAVLGAPLVVVMGHARCGAVDAACKVVSENKTFPGAIGRMIEPIIPSVLKAQKSGGDTLDEAVRENARRMAATLRSDPILAPLQPKSLRIVSARYGLDDGAVEFLEGGDA